MNQREARATVLGFIAIFGVPLLGLLWLTSATPPGFFLASLVVFVSLFPPIVFLVFLLAPLFVYAADPEEAKRKARVRFLQQQVFRLKCEVGATKSAIHSASYSMGGARVHQVPPLQRKLGEQETELAKARRELNTIWKQTDGIFDGKGFRSFMPWG